MGYGSPYSYTWSCVWNGDGPSHAAPAPTSVTAAVRFWHTLKEWETNPVYLREDVKVIDLGLYSNVWSRPTGRREMVAANVIECNRFYHTLCLTDLHTSPRPVIRIDLDRTPISYGNPYEVKSDAVDPESNICDSCDFAANLVEYAKSSGFLVKFGWYKRSNDPTHQIFIRRPHHEPKISKYGYMVLEKSPKSGWIVHTNRDVFFPPTEDLLKICIPELRSMLR